MDATLQFALGNIARHCEGSRAGDARDPGAPREHKGQNGLTHEVRSGCADDPIRAPLLRSLLKKFGHTDAEELHDNIINGFMLIENLWREWGGHRDPMSLPPCPTTNFVFL